MYAIYLYGGFSSLVCWSAASEMVCEWRWLWWGQSTELGGANSSCRPALPHSTRDQYSAAPHSFLPECTLSVTIHSLLPVIIHFSPLCIKLLVQIWAKPFFLNRNIICLILYILFHIKYWALFNKELVSL